MDVNERIVNSWLQNKLFFTINSIFYGQFHNDIDILAINIKKKEVWDCEVKVRTGSTMISDNDNKQNGFKHFVNTFQSQEREDKLKQYVNNDFTVKQKFITTKSLFGKTEENQKKWFNKFAQENIEVIYFDEVMNELYKYAIQTKKSTDEIVQVLRLLQINQKE